MTKRIPILEYRGMDKVILVLFLLHGTGFAFDGCFDRSGAKYGIDPNLLRAIAMTESAMQPSAIGDEGKSKGLMQIHQFWKPKLDELGIKEEDLFMPCVSIDVGAWILAQEMMRYGMTWAAVGAYNTGAGEGKDGSRKRYIGKVYAHYRRLVHGGVRESSKP